MNDALQFCKWVEDRNWSTTISAWSSPKDTKDSLVIKYKEIMDAIRLEKLNTCMAIKPSLIEYDLKSFEQITGNLKDTSIRIQVDSLYPNTTDKTLEFFKGAKKLYDNMGYTLPSRWRRSMDDADVMIENQATVRIVKGQWRDPNFTHLDIDNNFLLIVEKLSNRVPHIIVASHDKVLIKKAINILKESGSKFELEQFFRYPLVGNKMLNNSKVDFRIYIPYGEPYLPIDAKEDDENPTMYYWILQDLLNLK